VTNCKGREFKYYDESFLGIKNSLLKSADCLPAIGWKFSGLFLRALKIEVIIPVQETVTSTLDFWFR